VVRKARIRLLLLMDHRVWISNLDAMYDMPTHDFGSMMTQQHLMKEDYSISLLGYND
jgi:hypothetical protein